MPQKPTVRNARSEHSLQPILESIRQIANCVGFVVIHTEEFKEKTDKEKIAALFYLGFDRQQIAAILMKDPDVVSVNLSQLGLTARPKSRKKEIVTDGKDQPRTSA